MSKLKTLSVAVSHETAKSTEELERWIRDLFTAGEEEVFEDGMESEFSRSLTSVIKQYGNDVVAVISNLILKEEVSPEVASEALRWMGQMDDPKTHASRLDLLKQSLSCSSAWVRDGASIGLACLDDPSAIPCLKAAIEQEPYELLRRNMALAIEDLQEGG